MSPNGTNSHQGQLKVPDRPFTASSRLEAVESPAQDQDLRPGIRVQVIEKIAIIRFHHSDILIGENSAFEMLGHLKRLIKTEVHPRFLLSLGGVRFVSSEMLGALVGFQREVDSRGGCVVLCCIDPLIRDVLRASTLDRVFEICDDEAAALGLIVH